MNMLKKGIVKQFLFLYIPESFFIKCIICKISIRNRCIRYSFLPLCYKS